MKFYAAVLAVLFAFPLHAQFSDRVEVRLLELEATVLDKEGRPVENLTREDFIVTLDGRPAEITNFSLVSHSAPSTMAGAPATAAHEAIVPPIPTRVVIVFDDLHLHAAAKAHAVAGLRDYIAKSLDAQTTATIVTWGMSLKTRVTPTANRERLLRGLNEVAREQPKGMAVDAERRAFDSLCSVSMASCNMAAQQFAESQAVDLERTLRAMSEVIESLGGMEGRKIIFFISEGLPMNPGLELFTRMRGTRAQHLGAMHSTRKLELKNLIRTAQDAGVVFNTIDPSLGIGAEMLMNPFNINVHQIRDNAHRTVRLLAEETGGRLITDRNDIHRAAAELERQMSTFYSMAVRAPQHADDANVKVKLRGHADLRVLTATRRSLKSREQSVAGAVRAQLYERRETNPLEASLSIQTQHASRCTAAMQLLVPRKNIPLTRALDIRLAVLDHNHDESDVYSSSIHITEKHGSVIGQIIPVVLADGRQYVLSVGIIDRATGATSYLQRDVDCR
jgi:VWFA-related protein